MIDTDPPAIPAATLILFRDRPGRSADLLFVERAATMAFAPGAIVFPGGRVDPGDEDLAATMAWAPADAAARIAAIRETIEEAGVAVGLGPRTIDAIRPTLLSGATIGDALAAADAAIDLDALVPFARWRPTHRPTRVFDTRFYLAQASDDMIASVDGRENVRLFWSSAAAVLAEADAGNVSIIFPTRCNLERLAGLPSFAAAVANARAYPVKLIAPRVKMRDGVAYLCIPEQAGYPITSVPMVAAVRG